MSLSVAHHPGGALLLRASGYLHLGLLATLDAPRQKVPLPSCLRSGH